MTRTKKRYAGTIEEDQKKQFIRTISSKGFNDKVRKTWNAATSNHPRIIADWRNPLIKPHIEFASKHRLPWTIEQSDKARQSAYEKNPPGMSDHKSIAEQMDGLKLLGGSLTPRFLPPVSLRRPPAGGTRRRIHHRRARLTHRRRN